MDLVKNSFEKLNEQAKKDGVLLELLLTASDNLKLGYQQEKLEKFESTQSQVAGLRVIDGSAQGYAYTENLSFDSLLLSYKEALRNAKTLKNSKDQSLIPLAQPQPTKDLSHLANRENIEIEKKLKIAEELEGKPKKLDSRVQSVPYTSFVDVESSVRILNSNGVDLSQRSNYYMGYTYVLAKEGDSTKMDGDSVFARNFAEVDTESVARKAVENAVARLGAQKLKTGKYAVVLDREVVPSFVGMLEEHLSAQAVLEGKSLLAKRLDEKIASPLFELIDDPFNERSVSVRSFDIEGTPSKELPIFVKGVLKSYLTNLETAVKLGVENTGHAMRSPMSKMSVKPSTLVVSKGDASLPSMLASHKKIIHLTEINGGLHSGYDETTGDFSLPCEGFLYEDGKRIGPVEQFVMSGNILSLLRDIEAVGNEYNKSGASVVAPDLLIKELSFAGA